LLKKEEYLLYSQTIKGNKKMPTSDLEPFYRQKANQRLFGLPIMHLLWLYYQGQKFYKPEKAEQNIQRLRDRYDSRIAAADVNSGRYQRLRSRRDRKLEKYQKQLDEGNWLMRIGEPPVVFDSLLTRETAEQMKFFLNSKGYFEAETNYSFELDEKRRNAKVTYQITENEANRIKDTLRSVDNVHIDSLLRSNRRFSLIKPGDTYDEDLLNQERERIDRLLKNNGYFNFNRQYVEYRVFTDSTFRDRPVESDNLIDIETVINKPPDRPSHKLYRVDDVYFTIDANILNSTRRRRDTADYQNIKYVSYNTNAFSKKILDTKLMIRPGDLYSFQNTIETQRLLTSLDIFKFANIYYDTTGNKFISRISASPLEKYTVSDEWGVTVTQQLPGPFVNLTFKMRNVFGGLEVFETSIRAAIEGQSGFSDVGQVYASQEFNANASLAFPQILFPGSFKNTFNRYNPRTRLIGGFNFTNRPEYRRATFRGAMNYTFQKDLKHTFIIAPVDANLVYTPYLSEPFSRTLDSLANEGSNLFRSFQRTFYSSINATYTYNDNPTGIVKEARYQRAYVESGGTTLNLAKLISNNFRNDSIEGVQLSRFFKFSHDFRYYLPAGRKSNWAFRLNVGLASPYGDSQVMPYEKYFFVGGSNSIRAWPSRRLGPGADPDILIANTNDIDYGQNYNFEQPGDILLEASVEYRFDIISFLEGALFVDAGNVWIWKSQFNLPEGQFRFNQFYKQIAVGPGAGLRMDFSFLIVRLDMGVKAYDPGKPEGQRWMINQVSSRWPFFAKQQAVFNVGIGYPF
jgi:outer membrane protein assembly factor BamA